jgi:hypothetical protein
MFDIAITADNEAIIYKVIAIRAPVLYAISFDLNRLLFQLSIHNVEMNELFLLKIFLSKEYLSLLK